ncbi:matrix metalloproteinase-19 [Protopterus annectens]|uniref:matrix metalloproteinase-19 n=1 Tax=Protopterus annectens TaxID=7888 RepID=UPI001CFAA1A5|nr:matrix metalloproteinase-19 [Protopterus annectens]
MGRIGATLCISALICFVHAAVIPTDIAKEEKAEAKDYLVKFGYLHKPLENITDEFQEHEIEDAIRVFQVASHLPVTGVLDEATITMMKQPRCGVEDSFNKKSLKYLLLGHWRKRKLTYIINNFTPDMSVSDVRTAISTAFQYWSNVSSLTFREVPSGSADIRISFKRKYHNCGQPFDGPGKILAHADIPEEGTIHFDEDEQWTENTYSGANLRIVAAHEIGHALGLGHSRYTGALMAPFYKGYTKRFQLHYDDIKGIQALYGKGITYTEPEFSTTSTPPTGKIPDPCTADLDAIILGPYGKTYAFQGDYVWLVTDYGVTIPVPVKTLWKGLPGNINAAVHSPRTGKTYFLKGDKVWRYTNFRMDLGYPKQLTRIPPNIDAALYWNVNKKIFFFKGDSYWQWDELTWTDLSRYPKKTSKLFTGAPSKPDAALTWKNDKVYFFKGDNYWRLNSQLRVESGYPKSKAKQWMQCQNYD